MKRRTMIWTASVLLFGLIAIYLLRPLYLINRAENILTASSTHVTSAPDSSFYEAMEILYSATRASIISEKARTLMDIYTSRYMAEYIIDHQRLKNEYYTNRSQEIQRTYNAQVNSDTNDYEKNRSSDSIREKQLEEIRKYLEPETQLPIEAREEFCKEWSRFEAYLHSLNSRGANLNILENCSAEQ